MRKLIAISIVLVGLLNPVVAQTPVAQEPQLLSECLNAVQEYQRRQINMARDAGKRPNNREILKAKTELAQKFAARFKLEKVEGPDLILLARLYQEAEQIDLAFNALNKRLTESDLTPPLRAETLLSATQTALASPVKEENVRRAESCVAELDSMPDKFIKQKLEAHSRLGGYYSYADIDEKNLDHHNAILGLIGKLSQEERKVFNNAKINAYQSIALVKANRGAADQAIETLKQARAEFSGSQNVVKSLDKAIELYSLVGKAGAPIKGDFWINAPPETRQVDLRGRVTLIQFTAHWCGPCRKSYPAMLKFHEQFSKDGLEVMLATQLYGYFEDSQELKPEAEMEANRKYYIERHKIPFKISVQARPERTKDGVGVSGEESNESKYFVGGIPQIVLLDKRGVVRQILIGWDPANESRVTQLIEKLLKEP
jgi:thiol-disulfide isomerase/thioredoxin